MSEIAIRAQELSKMFRLAPERRTSLKERVVRGRGNKGQEFWALKDATFDVPKGSMFGIIGHNGSGKSTALKVIAGIYRPTAGRVVVNGKLSALLELGAGFHGELTGRENIVLNASILGLSRKQIDAAMDDIIEFADLGQFIDSPVKTYSSGMYVRLGFAVAVKVDPEILVIDEVIAVGDEDFQRKCFDYIAMLRRRGSTIVIVTHSMGLVTDRCDVAMWLDHGEVQELGPSRQVVDAYMRKVNAAEAQRNSGAPVEESTVQPRRGSGEIRVTALELLDESGEPVNFLISGKPGVIRMYFNATGTMEDVIFGLGFFNELGANVSGPNSGREGSRTITPGVGHIDFRMPEVLLAAGSYTVSTAIVSYGDFVDFMDRAFEMRVRTGSSDEPGMMLFPGTWTEPFTVPGGSPATDGSLVIPAPDQIGRDFAEALPNAPKRGTVGENLGLGLGGGAP
ncbi:MAG: ABC transporter ATP-binding protein [Actinobacteria bacterium]|nr:ABC transporter ATP-binding protein [Actinomycetota bacterium]